MFGAALLGPFVAIGLLLLFGSALVQGTSGTIDDYRGQAREQERKDAEREARRQDGESPLFFILFWTVIGFAALLVGLDVYHRYTYSHAQTPNSIDMDASGLTLSPTEKQTRSETSPPLTEANAKAECRAEIRRLGIRVRDCSISIHGKGFRVIYDGHESLTRCLHIEGGRTSYRRC